MAGPGNRGLEATMTLRPRQSLDAKTLHGSREEEGASTARRTLRRVIAAAVAIAAISPLFAADPSGCARTGSQSRSTQRFLSSQTSAPHPQ